MSYLTRMMRQTATWWDYSTINEYGDPSFASPLLLTTASGNAVRWEHRSELFKMPNGDEYHSKAIVWSATQEFAVGDYLFLGSSVTTNPETVSGADRVRHAEKVPDIGNKKLLYKAVL
jgi:hypothetical protein